MHAEIFNVNSLPIHTLFIDFFREGGGVFMPFFLQGFFVCRVRFKRCEVCMKNVFEIFTSVLTIIPRASGNCSVIVLHWRPSLYIPVVHIVM